jgi:hypothetical protein
VFLWTALTCHILQHNRNHTSYYATSHVQLRELYVAIGTVLGQVILILRYDLARACASFNVTVTSGRNADLSQFLLVSNPPFVYLCLNWVWACRGGVRQP